MTLPDPMRRSPDGVPELVENLLRRPSRGERRLPLLWLLGEERAAVLDELGRRLTESRATYCVPAARIREPFPGTTRGVADLLAKAGKNLSVRKFGGPRLTFPLFELAEWLLRQQLSEEAGEAPAHLLTLLRQRRHQHRGGSAELEQPPIDLTGPWQTAFSVLRRLVPRTVFRAAVSGRLPGIGRIYRWFMRQQYLAPQQSGTFLGFAERLTARWWPTEPEEQVRRLLVHAFLEDLRRAYTRRSWRTEGRRRTAYPVLLLEDAEPGTAGYLLLRLVNDVRNETGRGDPLLVICTSVAGPPPLSPNKRPEGPRRATTPHDERTLRAQHPEYREWAESLPRRRRARTDTAWHLPIAVTPADHAAGPAITPARPPWYASRITTATVTAAVLLAPVAWVAAQSGDLTGAGCWHRPFAGETAVRLIEDECVGYSDGAFFFGDEDQTELRAVQRRIFEQNRRADDIRADNDRRPVVTLIYLGTLTGRTTVPGEEAYAAEREELEGLATAQLDSLEAAGSATDRALIRVVVANGGKEMKHATDAVQLIAGLAGRDPTVTAVIGLVESRTSTADAMRELNRIGLPIVAPTLSADDLHLNSRLYLQLAPPNAEQARLIGDYARAALPQVTESRVFYTSGGGPLEEDLYVGTLLAGLRAPAVLPSPTEQEYTPGMSLDRVCGYQGLLVFAGRWSEFDDFLRSLQACNTNPPAHLVADDSVNRYMANETLRKTAQSNLPVTFVSKSALGTCPALAGATDEVRTRFLRLIRRADLLSPPRCVAAEDGSSSGVPVGERVSLAYDAAVLVREAVERLGARLRPQDPGPWDPRAVNPAGVHAEILRRNEVQPFEGVTGVLALDQETGVPRDKRQSLLRVDNITDVLTPAYEVFHCGRATKEEPAEPDAPCRAVAPASGR
ncbi:MAG TPA: hypothetical protein VGD67_19050 [Pseudonocardiaceae bacterium]